MESLELPTKLLVFIELPEPGEEGKGCWLSALYLNIKSKTIIERNACEKKKVKRFVRRINKNKTIAKLVSNDKQMINRLTHSLSALDFRGWTS